MCYNNCEYEVYNPVTGDSHCHRGKNPCPETLITCGYCDYEMPDIEEECPRCGMPVLDED